MVFRPDDCNATWIPEPDFSMVKPRGDHMSLLVSVVCANRQSCQGRRGGGRGGRRGGGEEGPAEDKPGIKTSRTAERIAATNPAHPKIVLLPALFLRIPLQGPAAAILDDSFIVSTPTASLMLSLSSALQLLSS